MRSTTYGTVEPTCDCKRTQVAITRDQLLVPEPMPMTYDDLLAIGIGDRGLK